MITAEEIKRLLHLKSHPEEGGYFIETYRSDEPIPEIALPGRYRGTRCYGTAIYYLLTPETFSAIHRLRSDEIFHFYLGDPAEILQLWPDGSGKILILGSDILKGMQPQVIVPRHIWQGARLLLGGTFALLGTTVSPGFEFKDYESGKQKELISSYPGFRDLIVALTKEDNVR